MGRCYYDDVLDVAIKYAGRDILRDIASQAPAHAEEAQFSKEFERNMARIIGAEAHRKRRRNALKVLTRAAAVLLIVLFVSSAVVFSSEALRTEVFNMFASIGDDSVSIGAEVDSAGVPEGMTVPGYVPEGFRLTEAKQTGNMRYIGTYEDASGNMIKVEQLLSENLDLGIDNDGNAYETEISGVKAIASENDDNSVIAFLYKEYAYTFIGYGEVGLPELIRIAESIIIR